MNLRKRITVFTGHYGSGKTELALNAAFTARTKNNFVALADLDVINPYFRSRDAVAQLKEKDIKLIAPHERLAQADLPIVSGDIYRYLHDDSYQLIIDAGGDKDGATALGQYYNEWKAKDIDLLFVLNANRPNVSHVKGVISTIKNIETASRMKITGIINNSNVGSETTLEDVQKGEELASIIASKLGIPFLFTTTQFEVDQQLPVSSKHYVIQRYMKVPWE